MYGHAAAREGRWGGSEGVGVGRPLSCPGLCQQWAWEDSQRAASYSLGKVKKGTRMRQEAQRSEGRKGHFQAPYEQEEGVLATETEMDCVSKQIASTLSELWSINLLCKQSKMLAN